MQPIEKAIGWLLAVYYSLVPNPGFGLGLAIIMLTGTVMLLLFPLTAKQARSMIAMQRVQPEIKKIQQKFKDDKAKQNEEIMRFYQENKINPLSGCLPLLMQMPVFFALFAVLRSMHKKVPSTGGFTDLYNDLCPHAETVKACKPEGLRFLGMDLSLTATQAKGGLLSTLPYFILVALVVLTGWYQARQTMARQKQSGTTPLNTQAQIIGKVMPVAFGLLSLNFASGLVVYFVTSNLWRIGQQQLVLNKIYENEHAKAGPTWVDAKAKDAPAAPDPERPSASGAKAAGRPAAPRPTQGARRKKKKRKR